jgi:hypothetical protein
MSELRQLAEAAAHTGFYNSAPGQTMSPEQVLLVAMTGRDLGMSYTAALRSMHVIKGKVSLSADGAVGCVLASGIAEFFETTVSTDQTCTVETKRRGGRSVRSLTFTLADAQRAGLTSNPSWGKYPAAMLRARAKSALARDVYPDILAGIYDPDEVEPAGAEVSTKAQVVQAKERPAPTGKESLQVDDLRARLAVATTPAEFAALAQDAVSLTNGDKDAFRAEFKARKATVATAPAPVAALARVVNEDAEDCPPEEYLDMSAGAP